MDQRRLACRTVLPGDTAVEAVLLAAGQPRSPARAGRGWAADLTDREVEVLRELARGLTNNQMAQELHVSEATVHTHVINIYGKTGAKTRAGAELGGTDPPRVGSLLHA